MKTLLFLAVLLSPALGFAVTQDKPQAVCVINLESSDSVLQAIRTEVFFATMEDGQDLYLEIPFNQLLNPEFIASGITANLKSFPHLQILGGRLYKESGADNGSMIPFNVIEVNEMKKRKMTFAELQTLLSRFYADIPMMLTRKVPSKTSQE